MPRPKKTGNPNPLLIRVPQNVKFTARMWEQIELVCKHLDVSSEDFIGGCVVTALALLLQSPDSKSTWKGTYGENLANYRKDLFARAAEGQEVPLKEPQ